MENEKIIEGLQMLKEALTTIGTPRLIIKDESFMEFAKVWLVKEVTNDPNWYVNGDSKSPTASINSSSINLHIRKGLGVNKVIFISKERLHRSGLPLIVSRVYTREYYDDVCDVLVGDKIPIAIDLDTE